MSTYTNQTDYVGNWRGELTAVVDSTCCTATTVTPKLTAAIGRKGTGTLVTATYYYKVGTTSGGTNIANSSTSLDKDGWTSSGQSRQIWTGSAPAITRGSSSTTQTYYCQYRYHTSSTTSNWYTASVTVTIYPTLNFENQIIKKVFSTSAQTFSITAATGGTGSYQYSEISEKNSSGTATSYFSISGTTVTMAASTPAGTYTYVIRATDGEGATKDATYTVTVARVVLSASSGTATYPTAITFTVTTNTSGGTLSVASNATGTATASISSTTVTVTPKALTTDGNKATITVTSAANGNYMVASATYTVTVNRGTITLTPVPYSGTYNGSAHSASIKSNVAGTSIGYSTTSGTYTTYSVTCTNANTNYAMSSVTRTVTGTTTVYYSATKNGYTVTGSTTITISNGTLTITPTAYNAIYNGAAYSASIKCTNAGSVTISYGTSTSYGQTLTATTKGTNYSMTNVTRTVPGTTTVYYKASKTYYNDVTGSTTIKITGVPVHTNVSGTWKHGAVYLNINGTWKPATEGYVNINGTWKSINK